MYEDYIYARISEDELELEKGVTRQLKEGRALSAARGPSRIAGEWMDNDISALPGGPRAGYDALVAAITAPNPAGLQRRIIVRHTDRLWRNRAERAAGIDLLGRHGIIVLPIHGPELHLSSAAGRLFAGVIGEVDTAESEIKAERIRSAVVERAEEGRANGAVLYGWRRIYDYDSKGRIVGFTDVEDPDTAPVVREIVSRLLSGESLKAVTDDLNRRGVPAPGAGQSRARRARGQASDGSRWGKTSVKKIALRPANVGLRVFHRGRPDEQLMPAAWPALIDRDQHDRVVALLADPARNIEKPGARQHLLTWGIGECGVDGCGAWLRVGQKGNARYGSKSRLYLCEARGCVGRNQEAVDRFVDAHMIALLRRDDVAELLSGSNSEVLEHLRRAEAIRARMTLAATDYADGRIEADQLRIITSRLRPQLEEAERMAQACRPSPHLEIALDSVGDQAAAKWASRTVTQKRAIMNAFGVRVLILPTRRGPGFDPDSVLFLPREPQR